MARRTRQPARIALPLLVCTVAVGCGTAIGPGPSSQDATSAPPATHATATPPSAAPTVSTTTPLSPTPTTAASATLSSTPLPAPTQTLNPAAGYPDLEGWILFEHFGQAPDGSTSEFDFHNRMLWLVHADGTDLHELAPGTPVDGKSSPDFSPDGTTVAFSSWLPLARIWTAPVSGGAPTLVSSDCSGAETDCMETDPAFSADGTRLAFAHRGHHDGAPYWGIGIRDLTTGEATYLEETRVPAVDGYLAQPSWSPAGDEIVYYRVLWPDEDEHPSDTRLFIVADDGSAVRELPRPDGRWAADPDWSADGKSILFSTAPNRETEGWAVPWTEIWTIKPDGTGLTQICDCGWAPSWSPDGKQIMHWGNRTFALMDADGGNRAHINAPQLTWFGDELGYGYAGILQPQNR